MRPVRAGMLPEVLFLSALGTLAAGQGRFLYKGVGETCDESAGKLWSCLPEDSCPVPAERRRTLDVCSRAGRSRVVCCPPAETAATPPNMANLAKSQRKCQLYGDYVYYTLPFPIGRRDGCHKTARPLIKGGEDAQLAEFPHMVRLGYGEKNKKGRVTIWGCGGSLISEWFILTAAHCLYAPETKIKVRWANVGDLVVGTQKDKAPNQIIEVVEHFVPPQYHPDRKYHDIALLKLAREVRLSTVVRPACLNRLEDPGQKFIVTGWGRTGEEFENRFSPALKKVELELVPLESCAQHFKGFHNLPDGVNRSMICAGKEKGKDTCRGDSGGPLMVMQDNPYCTFSLVGIVSFGLEECGKGEPSVFTRVSEYVPWIEDIVWAS